MMRLASEVNRITSGAVFKNLQMSINIYARIVELDCPIIWVWESSIPYYPKFCVGSDDNTFDVKLFKVLNLKRFDK